MCSYMRMFTVRHILIAWRMLRKGCYGNSNVLAFSIVGQTKTIRISVPRVDAIFSFFENGGKKIPVFQNIRILVYVWTASLLFAQGLHCDYWNGVHLEEDYPITTVFENNRFSSFFANAPITFKKMRAVSWEVRYAWLNLEFYCSVCKKTLRIYDFQKTLWLDNLLTSAPVRAVAL